MTSKGDLAEALNGSHCEEIRSIFAKRLLNACSRLLQFRFNTVSKRRRFPVARNRNRRPTHQDEPPHIEEIDASPEEIELADFLDSLGPQGISEVSLYR